MPSLPWALDVLPKIFRVGRFPLDDRDFTPVYQCPTHALHVYDYHADLRLGDDLIHLRPGDATLSPAGGRTAYHLAQPGFHWCVHFHPVPGTSGATERVDLPLHVHLGPSRVRVAETIARLGQWLAQGSPTALAMAAASLQTLLLSLHLASEFPADQTNRGAQVAENTAAILDANIVRPPSMPAIARRVGVSATHLARIFQQRYGMTAARYILGRRIEEASHLLHATDLPVNRIALRLGFTDAQHFNKQFRRVMGCSPTVHRRSIAASS